MAEALWAVGCAVAFVCGHYVGWREGRRTGVRETDDRWSSAVRQGKLRVVGGVSHG